MDRRKKILITAALPYVNNYPHLGNIIGSMLSADAYCRFMRMHYPNKKILFVCGTDEHGTPIELEAHRKNISPIELCNQYVMEHKRIYDWFNIEFDYFGRTSIKEHRETTQRIFTSLYENGHFYEKAEERPFCIKCDKFLADRFIKGRCYNCDSIANGDQCDNCTSLIELDRLKDVFCAVCFDKNIIRKSTTHFYFRIKNFADLEKKLNFDGFSQNAQRITKDWFKKIHDRAMTRDLKWGVPVPSINGKDYRDKVFYVWFDAPIAYMTFANLLSDENIFNNEEWSIRQFMGKDNVLFHSILFPAFCLGSGNENIVSVISSTEYLMFNGEKFSKSNRVGIFGSDLLDNRMGCSDFYRFYLLKIRPEKNDSNFSITDFLNSINNLQNTYCNLVSRIIKFIHKNGGNVEISRSSKELFPDFLHEFNAEYKNFLCAFEKIEIRRAVEIFLHLCTLLNNFIQKYINEKEFRQVVFNFAYSPLALIVECSAPFVPIMCEKYRKILRSDLNGLPEELKIFENHSIQYENEIFFEKLQKEQIDFLEQFK